MATRLNVIIKVDNFLKIIEPILRKHEVNVFVRRYNAAKGMYIKKYNDNNDDVYIGGDKEYKNLFLVSKEVNPNSAKSFYDDDVCPYAVECEGGRYNDKEVEVIEMRPISKTPDKTIKTLLSDLNSFFKKNDAFGMGILPLDNAINKNTFYFKEDTQQTTVWRYLDKKEFYEPIQIA